VSGPRSAAAVLALGVLLLAGALVPSRAVAAPDVPRAAGEAVVLVLDASGSMRADAGGVPRSTLARQAVDALTRDLPADLDLGFLAYGHRTDGSDREAGCADVEVLVPLGGDPSAVRAAADALEPGGHTPIGRALDAAAAALDGRAGTVVLVSDGVDTCAPPDPCAVARDIAGRGVEVRFEAIGFRTDAAADAQLRCIAEAGGGGFRTAQDAGELAAALRAYVVGGTPVTGGAARDDAVLLAPGRYRDTLALGETRWYAVEPAPGQAAVVEVLLAGDPDGEASPTAELRAGLVRREAIGELSCAEDAVGDVGVAVRTLALRGPAVDVTRSGCPGPGALLLPVTLAEAPTRGRGAADPLAGRELDLELRISHAGDPAPVPKQPVARPPARATSAPAPPPAAPPPPLSLRIGALAVLGLAGYGSGAAVARRTGP
jgi:hypothetical protein